LTACSGLSRPYPAKEFFALTVPEGAVAHTGPGRGVVRIEAVRIAQPFDQRVFVYRMAGDRLEFDYYREYAASPSALLTAEAVRSLAGCGRFETVLAPGTGASARYSIEASVERLEGDYRDPQRAEAVIVARFFLIDQGPSTALVLREWTIESRIPFPGNEPDALAGALARGWGELLDRLVQGTGSIDLVQP
jgi:uncharacterized lipoprotein YmbA